MIEEWENKMVVKSAYNLLYKCQCHQPWNLRRERSYLEREGVERERERERESYLARKRDRADKRNPEQTAS
jgi:hypothetical protein